MPIKTNNPPTKSKHRIIFAGTSAFGLPSLAELLSGPHNVVGILTKPNRRQGRGQKWADNPITEYAKKQGLPIHMSEKIDEPLLSTLKMLQPDLIVVAAYGILIPENLLKLPPFGCMNIHASLLPRFRGASPIQQAILSGDPTSGITFMKMDKGLDTGDMLAHYTTPLHANDNSQALHDRLADIAAEHINDMISHWLAGKIAPQAQNNDLATYAHKINKENGQINWNQDAEAIDRHIRAYNPYPIAYTTCPQGAIRIFKAKISNKPSQKSPGTIEQITRDALSVATQTVQIDIQVFQCAHKAKQHIDESYHSLPWQLDTGLSFS
jgi:methionyl-tRNA formyltransferase